MSEQRNLFSEVSVRQRFDKMRTYATAAIEGMETEDILSCDIDATVRALVADYEFTFPTLDESNITVSGEAPAQLRPPSIYLATFHVPFSGEREVFTTQPITPPSSPPFATLLSTEIQVTFRDMEPQSDNIRRQFDQRLYVIKRYLQALQTEFDRGFSQLSTDIKSLLVQRRTQLERAGQVVKELGYPLKRRTEPNPMAVPLTRKKITIARSGAPKPVAMEPYLAEAIYGEILNVLASMSLLIERNPTTFGHVEEPLLRDHFLLQLNGQFEGAATGETFNGSGKTDILLRVEDKNVFIAECKFWDGQQSLIDAIDQLFRYLTWRDSKAAILVFSRRKDFSHTIEEARKALKQHRQFRQELPSKRETSFSGWLARPDDEQRRIELTVMLFNVPTA